MKSLYNVLALLVIVGIFTPSGLTYAVDANFNSQLSNIRSAASGVPTDPTLGFDPCKDGTNTAGVCGGAVAAGALLSTVNVGTTGTPGIFSTLGPGAITDNMFGIISGPALGANGATGGAGANDGDTPTTRCAPGTGTANFDTSNPTVNLNGLNCGSIRINATQQGQTFPAGPNTLGLQGNGTVNTVTKNMSFIADNCPIGVCPGNPHVGFNLTNNFSFRMNTDASNVAIPGEATTTSSQVIRQVTGVNPNAVIGTLTVPGGGDQLFEVTSNFTALSPDTGNGDPAADRGLDGIFGTPDDTKITVNWTQRIEDPDQSGTSGVKFLQSLSGSFVRDAQFGGLSQVFDCPSGSTATTTNICTQYPNGASQTAGDVAGANLP